MEVVQHTDGFDSTSTADILTFELEEVELLQTLSRGVEMTQATERLEMGERELDACIESLIGRLSIA
ncbi:MAG: hypothetical protein IPM23_06620 [Candidatus Melainabacteria bacterium]|nr:hypothetical protein [Candidatus Melainabacteria bacterium]